MWKLLFIGGTILAIYFSYGVAQQGGPWAFFAGATVGAIVSYLFTRYHDEKQKMIQKQKQDVRVSVSQNVDSRSLNAKVGDMSLADLADLLVEIVDSRQEKKQLLPPIDEPGIVGLTPGEQLALAIKAKRRKS